MSVDIGKGETVRIDFKIPANAAGSVRPVLSADCGCGGRMIPHPRKPLVWICDRSHWWNRRKHAYLIGRLR